MKDVDTLLGRGREVRSSPDAMMEAIKTYLKVRGRDGAIVPLEANNAQKLFEARHKERSIVLKARQMGLTTWIAARFFMKTITGKGVLTVQVAHTREAAEGIFRIVQRFWENLPPAWREGPNAPLRRSRANVGQMCFPELDSEFRIVSAGDPGAGRGLSIQNLHLSEVSRWPGNAAETLAGLRAALAPHGELVIESTPNGAGGCFYDEWVRAASADEDHMVQHFFPWWLEPAYISAPVAKGEYTDEERELARKEDLSPAQIGFRRALEQGFHGLRAQEFAEDAMSCFLASGECCFDVEAIMQRLKDMPEPVERKDGMFRWFPSMPDKEYIVAADTAGGGASGDFAAVQVIEKKSGVQCVELKKKVSPRDLARAAAKLAREYNDALIAIERNNHGHAVLAYLLEAEKYNHLYAQNGKHGWLTDLVSKPAMVARMRELLDKEPKLFRSERLLSECRTFVTQPNGGAGALAGAHDDLVMAMAIAQSVRAETQTRR